MWFLKVGKGVLGYWFTYVVAAVVGTLYYISERFRLFVQFCLQQVWDGFIFCLQEVLKIGFMLQDWAWNAFGSLADSALTTAFNSLGLPENAADTIFDWVEMFNLWLPIDTMFTILGLIVTGYASKMSLRFVGRMLGMLK